MSKGSAPRPFEVDRKKYEDNWDAIFGKKPEPKPEEKKDDDKDKQ
jgi:hypothetical protein